MGCLGLLQPPGGGGGRKEREGGDLGRTMRRLEWNLRRHPLVAPAREDWAKELVTVVVVTVTIVTKLLELVIIVIVSVVTTVTTIKGGGNQTDGGGNERKIG